jgi:hypothetical protein
VAFLVVGVIAFFGIRPDRPVELPRPTPPDTDELMLSLRNS